MCGICGVYEYASSMRVDGQRLARMNATITHRGPDDDGFFVRDRVGLAMRRLRIIDLAGGKQPITNEDETVTIVFNGEIYNYRELRRELVARGHRFRTQSDTEVVVHAYEEFGTSCVERLDGMFAFAIYDERVPGADRLFLARDPFGKKPLYYADLGQTLIFGSEIKPILEDPRVSRDVDFEALHHYLSLLVIPAPWSIFQSIRKLPAGHWMLVDRDGSQIERYWSCETNEAQTALPEADAIDEVRRLLFRAVEKRLVADVPLGAFLSGGLDSSLVVAIMARLSGQPVKTLSVGFEGPRSHNELPFARRLAEHCRTDHTELMLKPDVVSMVHDVVHYADEPFGISSAFPSLLIARAARERLTVVLTGDGGDEMFGGYSHYLWERWATAFRRLPRVADSVLLTAAGTLGRRVDGRAVLCKVGSRGLSPTPADPTLRDAWAGGAHFRTTRRSPLYSDDLAHLAAGTTTAVLERHLDRSRRLEPAALQNRIDVELWLPDEMLAKVDRMTMGASIEARCPLLDRDLARFLFGLPFSQKVPGSPDGISSICCGEWRPICCRPICLHAPSRGSMFRSTPGFAATPATCSPTCSAPSAFAAAAGFGPKPLPSWSRPTVRGTLSSRIAFTRSFSLELWAQEYLS